MSEAPSLPRKTRVCQFVLLSHPVAHTALKKRTCSSFQVSITDRKNCESVSSREPVDVFTQVSKVPSSTRRQTLQSFQSCQEWFSLFLAGAVQALTGNLLQPQMLQSKNNDNRTPCRGTAASELHLLHIRLKTQASPQNAFLLPPSAAVLLCCGSMDPALQNNFPLIHLFHLL